MRRLIKRWWKQLAVLLLVGSALSSPALLSRQQQRMLKEGADEIQMALERYAVDTEGSYPTDAEELIEKHYLAQWPRSPYGGRMEPLDSRMPAKPGCFHYVPAGPLIAVPGKDGVPRMVMPWERETMGFLYPREMDTYVLAVYGTRSNPKLAEWAEQSAIQSRNRAADRRRENVEFTPFDQAPWVEWGRVAIVKTAGEDLGL
jgi:hypothetical protein